MGDRMKETDFVKFKLYFSEDIDELWPMVGDKLSYPFTLSMLKLLKRENHFEQEYYLAVNADNYAFFTVYKDRLNILTYGRANIYMKLRVVGFPCSLSNSGYVTDNMELLLEAVRCIKGCKLVLNVENPILAKGFAFGETLPTCVLDLRWNSIDDFMNSLRSSYRRRIRLAIEKCNNVEIKVLPPPEANQATSPGANQATSPEANRAPLHDADQTTPPGQSKFEDIDVYPLYFNTYNKSNYKLEKLERGFFEQVDATRVVYLIDGKPAGFTLLKNSDGHMDFMLCGMDYSRQTADLYFYMLYKIVEFAINLGCKSIDFGQTSELTKMKFGAIPQKRYFYAHHSNPLVNQIAIWGRHLLEYKYDFPKFEVFKDIGRNMPE